MAIEKDKRKKKEKKWGVRLTPFCISRLTKEVQTTVDRVAVLREVVGVKLLKALVAVHLVGTLAVVVVGNLLAGRLFGGHDGWMDGWKEGRKDGSFRKMARWRWTKDGGKQKDKSGRPRTDALRFAQCNSEPIETFGEEVRPGKVTRACEFWEGALFFSVHGAFYFLFLTFGCAILSPSSTPSGPILNRSRSRRTRPCILLVLFFVSFFHIRHSVAQQKRHRLCAVRTRISSMQLPRHRLIAIAIQARVVGGWR